MSLCGRKNAKKNGSLAYILTDDGRLTPKTGGGYDCEYFIKDHLGNNRVTVWDSSGVAVVQQENHYYPFGLAMQGNDYQNPNQENVNKYTYNGKELQDDHGLEWLDYGARFYDSQIGRWHSVDSQSEKYMPITPYAYVANRPINAIDPDGNEIVNPYTKGTANYKTVNKALAVISKSNPDMYKYLDGHDVKIYFRIENRSDALVKRDGQCAVYSTQRRGAFLSINGVFNDNDENFGAYSFAYYKRVNGGLPSLQGSYGYQSAEQTFNDETLVSITSIDVYVDPSLSDKGKAEIGAHELGHGEFALKNQFERWIWSIIGKPEAEGHDKHNPDGKNADKHQEKARSFLSGLTIQDWEKIAKEFNKKKEENEGN